MPSAIALFIILIFNGIVVLMTTKSRPTVLCDYTSMCLIVLYFGVVNKDESLVTALVILMTCTIMKRDAILYAISILIISNILLFRVITIAIPITLLIDKIILVLLVILNSVCLLFIRTDYSRKKNR